MYVCMFVCGLIYLLSKPTITNFNQQLKMSTVAITKNVCCKITLISTCKFLNLQHHLRRKKQRTRKSKLAQVVELASLASLTGISKNNLRFCYHFKCVCFSALQAVQLTLQVIEELMMRPSPAYYIRLFIGSSACF